MNTPLENCPVIRRMRITHTTLSLATGERGPESHEWVTRACGIPLFGRQREAGICTGCATGWTMPMNYRPGDANDPDHQQEQA
jgi:hypothetical protein